MEGGLPLQPVPPKNGHPDSPKMEFGLILVPAFSWSIKHLTTLISASNGVSASSLDDGSLVADPNDLGGLNILQI